MRFNRPFEHLNDDQLLAYLDGEMSNARIRSVRTHLRICSKCRSTLAELEAQVEFISRLLLARATIDADRSARARERFLQWRSAFEAEEGPFTRFLSLQLFSHAQHEPDSPLSQLV
jgi:anti-sigma factor RsiW